MQTDSTDDNEPQQMGVALMPTMPTAEPRTLRQLREAKGWTQEDLLAAAQHQVSLATISGIENGRAPTKAVRKVLADALGVAVSEINWPMRQGGEQA